jgi:hypothetical protein
VFNIPGGSTINFNPDFNAIIVGFKVESFLGKIDICSASQEILDHVRNSTPPDTLSHIDPLRITVFVDLVHYLELQITRKHNFSENGYVSVFR